MKVKIMGVLLCLTLVAALVSCGSKGSTESSDPANEAAFSQSAAEENSDKESDGNAYAAPGESAENSGGETKDEVAEVSEKKQVIVYFPNWYLGGKSAEEGGEVGSIAWDSATIVNHAFFKVIPADGTTESSFERRAAGEAARTQFACVSTLPEADFEDSEKSEYNDSARNHFTQYAIYKEKYPEVKVLISVGGWSCSGYFSEMSYTAEGRKSFIDSCMELLKQYPFLDGIDIDWEYPAGSRDGERRPEDENEEGCPIWGTPAEDNENYTSLLKEMRKALGENFGEGEKLLTACASGSTGWTLPCQDWVSYSEHLDYINIMTYDLAGNWDGVTGHASSGLLTKAGFGYFINNEIEAKKLCIGSPLYPTWFRIDGEEMPANAVGAKIDKTVRMGTQYGETELCAWEKEAVKGYTYELQDGRYVYGEEFDESEDGAKPGWNFGFDKKKSAAYMYNNDPESEFYMWYASYENLLSLQEKLDNIKKYKLAGMIVWESSMDTKDHLLVSRMADFLNE